MSFENTLGKLIWNEFEFSSNYMTQSINWINPQSFGQLYIIIICNKVVNKGLNYL